MHSPSHRESKNRARKWVKTFVRMLHRGELPAPFGTPGVVNPVDRGLARNNLRWMDRPDFTIPIKRQQKARKRDDLDRSTWAAEDWQRWWQDMNTDLTPAEEKALDVESLKAEIKMMVETLKLNGSGSHAGYFVPAKLARDVGCNTAAHLNSPSSRTASGLTSRTPRRKLATSELAHNEVLPCSRRWCWCLRAELYWSPRSFSGSLC